MNKFIKLFLLSLIFLGNSWAIGDLPSANFIIDPSLTTLHHATTLNASSSRDTWGGKNLSYSFKLNNDGSWSNFSSSAIFNFTPKAIGKFKAYLRVKDKKGRISESMRWYQVGGNNYVAKIRLLTKAPQAGKEVLWQTEISNYRLVDKDKIKLRWDFDSDGIWDTKFSPQKIISHVYPLNFAGRKITPTVEIQWVGGRRETISGYERIHFPVPKANGRELNRYMGFSNSFIPNPNTKVSLLPASIFPPILNIFPGKKVHDKNIIFTFDISRSRLPSQGWVSWSFDGGRSFGYYGKTKIQRKFLPGKYQIVVQSCFNRANKICSRTEEEIEVVADKTDFQIEATLRSLDNNNYAQEDDNSLTIKTGGWVEFRAKIRQTSSNRTNNKLLYRWDFNNNGVWDTPLDEATTAKFQYLRAGKYHIKLQAFSSLEGTSNIAEMVKKTIIVKYNNPPRANFDFRVRNYSSDNNFSKKKCVYLDDVITFHSTSSDDFTRNGDLSGRFDVDGDGRWDNFWISNPTISWKFRTAGKFRIKFQVKDKQNLSSEIYKDFCVFNITRKQRQINLKKPAGINIQATPVEGFLSASDKKRHNIKIIKERTFSPKKIIERQKNNFLITGVDPLLGLNYQSNSWYTAKESKKLVVDISNKSLFVGQIFSFDISRNLGEYRNFKWFIGDSENLLHWRNSRQSPLMGDLDILVNQDKLGARIINPVKLRNTPVKIYRAWRTPGQKVITFSGENIRTGQREYLSFSVWTVDLPAGKKQEISVKRTLGRINY